YPGSAGTFGILAKMHTDARVSSRARAWDWLQSTRIHRLDPTLLVFRLLCDLLSQSLTANQQVPRSQSCLPTCPVADRGRAVQQAGSFLLPREALVLWAQGILGPEERHLAVQDWRIRAADESEAANFPSPQIELDAPHQSQVGIGSQDLSSG